MAKNYENLKIWQEAIVLATKIYKITRDYPKEEQFGITSQLRRAVVSVSSNIAEGAGRVSKKDNMRFIEIALGSLNEVESLLAVSVTLAFIDKETHSRVKEDIVRLGKSMGAYKNYLKK